MGTMERIIQYHKSNEYLGAANISAMPKNEKDLSYDQYNGNISQSMVDNVKKALDDSKTHYVDVPGIAPLRALFAEWLEKDFSVIGFGADKVMVNAGIQESRFLAIQMIGKDSGKVAIPAVVHPGVKKAAGVRPLEIEVISVQEDRALPGVDAIEEVLESGTKLVYLESPSRLTGAVYSPDEVKAIAKLAKKNKARIIWDQGLAPWTRNKYFSLAAVPGMEQNVVIIGEAFPAAGLQGLSLSYLGADSEWIGTITSQKQIMSICTSTPSQFAGVKAYDNYCTVLGDAKKALADAWSNVRKGSIKALSSDTLSIAAFRVDPVSLQKAGIGFAEGKDFGMDGVVRLSVTDGQCFIDAVLAMENK